MTQTSSLRPADAVAAALVDRAPPNIQPYLRLMRLDRPIGTWLLYWPCVFGLVLGAVADSRPFGSWRDWGLVLLLGIGAIVMRGAGCTYNDIVDRDFDAKVARTRGRPIPSGAVTVKQARLFAAGLSLIGLVILLMLDPLAIALGAGSLVLIAAYPFMKRITWWPQAWLGLTFNWGAPLGYAAATGHFGWQAVLLYASGFFWTLGYDTIYAVQDLEDDGLAGVKSSARILGRQAPIAVLGFYACAVVLALAAAAVAELGPLFLPFAALFAVHLSRQAAKLNLDDGAGALRLFRSNREAALLLFVGLVAGLWRSGGGLLGLGG